MATSLSLRVLHRLPLLLTLELLGLRRDVGDVAVPVPVPHLCAPFRRRSLPDPLLGLGGGLVEVGMALHFGTDPAGAIGDDAAFGTDELERAVRPPYGRGVSASGRLDAVIDRLCRALRRGDDGIPLSARRCGGGGAPKLFLGLETGGDESVPLGGVRGDPFTGVRFRRVGEPACGGEVAGRGVQGADGVGELGVELLFACSGAGSSATAAAGAARRWCSSRIAATDRPVMAAAFPVRASRACWSRVARCRAAADAAASSSSRVSMRTGSAVTSTTTRGSIRRSAATSRRTGAKSVTREAASRSRTAGRSR